MKTAGEYDVIVVGGGIAGATAAIRLSQLGYSILLSEKEATSHHKVCGEFLSAEAIPMLAEVGIDLKALGAVPIDDCRFISREQNLEIALPFCAQGVSRKTLDRELLRLAESSGVDVRRGLNVSSLKKLDGFQVQAGDKLFFAKDIFWAAGKNDVPRILKRRGRESSAIGYKRHLRLPEALRKSLSRRIELHLFEGGYGGISEVEGEVFNFCFILDKIIARKIGKKWEDILFYVSRGNSRLQELLFAAEWQWTRPVTVANLPYGHLYGNRHAEDSSFYVLGDQMAVIHSLVGDGMAMALLSAKKAVYYYHEAALNGASSEVAVKGYHREIRTLFAGPVKTGYRLHSLVRYRKVAELVMKTIQPFPKLTEALIKKTRCSPTPTGETNVH